MRVLLLPALAGLLVLAACGGEQATSPAPGTGKPATGADKAPDKLVLSQQSFGALAGWAQDDLAATLPALKKSCDRLNRLPADRAIGTDGMFGTQAQWRAGCAALMALPAAATSAAVRASLEQHFQPWRASPGGGAEPGLFTGYYEASLNGSRRQDGRYRTPLYRRPADLVMVDLGEFRPDWRGQRTAGKVEDGKLRPYADRAAVDAGALAGKGLELLWVDDPIEAFFAEIQGSARVRMADGGEIRIGYAAQNGHQYRPIGRDLVERGALSKDQVSMQTIRAWLERNPAEAPALMRRNPSVVFFREIPGDGPIGAQGVALTPGRSMAVDPRFIALGTPLWLEIDEPKEPGGKLRRLVVAQDTGGAIRGPVRGDLFWGHGRAASDRAGEMKQPGTYVLLLPRGVTPKL